MTKYQTNFDIPGIARVGPGRGGLTAIFVTSPLARADIYLHGAHITQFQPTGEEPVLWMSAKSVFHPAKAIRGGVPICFPWFGASETDPNAPAHGFARLADWRIEDISRDASGGVVVVLALDANEATLALWPVEFRARQTITIGTELAMSLEVTNTSGGTIRFEEALHSYLAVSDVRAVTIEGFGGVRYADKLDGGEVMEQAAAVVAFTGETDRVYLDVPEVCVLNDPGMARKIEIRSRASRDTVVWNPWVDKARRMADFGDTEWPGMVCIETANIGGNGIELAAGGVHTMSATLRVVAVKPAAGG